MKQLGIALLALLAVPMLVPAAVDARGYVSHPRITEREAEQDLRHYLRDRHPNWRYKTGGQLSCANGRLNRYTWVCRAWWYKGRLCHAGRARILNRYLEDGTIYYTVYWGSRRC